MGSTSKGGSDGISRESTSRESEHRSALHRGELYAGALETSGFRVFSSGKTREVSVERPELGNAVGEAEGGDAGVAHPGADDLARDEQALEHRPVTGGLTQ
jgi:hypothetical protein